ncbi:MAG: DUF871 domain-containing protein, partial [Lachnospiraceae bacterium]|nr:DUF871 domain-containing protein [Lachnospiraceae bacterium]
MKRLGISVYPERASKEACYAYMRLAGKYGFQRVFTCLLSVEESREKPRSQRKAGVDSVSKSRPKTSTQT